MNLGDKVIITGGTSEDWCKFDNDGEQFFKPYYTEANAEIEIGNRVTRAYLDKKVCRIVDKRQYSRGIEYDIESPEGFIFVGFYPWELKKINV